MEDGQQLMDRTIRKTVITALTFAVIGLALTIVVYIVTSNWICCRGKHKSLKDVLLDVIQQAYSRRKRKSKEAIGDEDNALSEVPEDEAKINERQNFSPLCKSKTLVGFVEVNHIISKVVIIVANIIYLSIVPKFDHPEPLPDEKLQYFKFISYAVTYAGSIYEIIVIIVFPIYIGMMHICCPKCWKMQCSDFSMYVKYVDLQFALSYSPFASVHQHYLGGAYWIFIVIRVYFYCSTFVCVVITGVRFFVAWLCIKFIDVACCSNGEAVEIKDYKHLIKDVGLQLFSVTINLFTGGSALATYFKIAVIQSDPVRYAYLAFTLLSCANAISSTFYNALLLRWVVMKEDNKADGSAGSKTLEFLKLKAPSSHISFVLGFVIKGGLVALNSYILHSGNLA